jgi:hypothetical protein
MRRIMSGLQVLDRRVIVTRHRDSATVVPEVIV